MYNKQTTKALKKLKDMQQRQALLAKLCDQQMSENIRGDMKPMAAAISKIWRR